MVSQPQSTNPTEQLESPLPREVLSRLYELMLKARLLSLRLRSPFSIGEAILAGTIENADALDTIVTAEHSPVLEVLRGTDLSSIAQLKLTSKDKLDDTSPDTKIVSAGALNTAGVALGMSLTLKRAQSSAVVAAFLPGKLAHGAAWREAIEFAGAKRLPILFVTDSTGSRISNSLQKHDCSHWPCPRIVLDGRDVIAVYRVCKEAMAAARRGYGPTFVDCINFVVPGSRGRDGRDPLTSFCGYLKRHNAWSDEWARNLQSQLESLYSTQRRRSTEKNW